MTNARSWGWCRPPHVGFINYASMLTSRVTASIAQARRGGVRPCWTQMNRSDSSQIPCPTPWLAGRGGKMEHREESPFCVSICAETSRSPSQSVLSCEHVLPAGRCCHVSNLGARLPSKGSWQSHPGWGGHRRPALGAPAGFGSGEDTCFFLAVHGGDSGTLVLTPPTCGIQLSCRKQLAHQVCIAGGDFIFLIHVVTISARTPAASGPGGQHRAGGER